MGLFSAIGDIFTGTKTSKTNSTSTDNSTATSSPWSVATPSVTNYLSNINSLYNGGAPQISSYEQSGYNDLANTVSSNAGNIGAATAANNATASGQYLTADTNPYLKDIATRISGIAGANSDATFSGRGRSGSGLAGYYNGQAVGDSLTNLYGQEYDSERQRQQSAIAEAPQLAASALTGPEAEVNAGQSISARPYDLASQYGGLLSNIANLGKTVTTNGTTTTKGTGSTSDPSNGMLGKITNALLFGTGG